MANQKQISEIIVRGGLGNQLFCVFYAYKQTLLGKTPLFNLCEYNEDLPLSRQFNVGEIIGQSTCHIEINKEFHRLATYVTAKSISRLVSAVRPNEADRLPGDRELIIKLLPSRSVHIGYFQHIENNPVDKKALAILKSNAMRHLEIERQRGVLGIHLRRGDYLLKKHLMHGIISVSSVITQAIKMVGNGGITRIRIFTDSPELINMQLFASLGVAIEIDSSPTPMQLLKEMASCSSFIAANSSLSLWAGLISDFDNFVIPSFWCKGVSSSVLGLDWIKRYRSLFADTYND